MALTIDEMNSARKAYREITLFDKRRQFCFIQTVLLLNFGTQILTHRHSAWLEGLNVGLCALMVGGGVYQWMDYRRLSGCYAANVELLRVLREREPNLYDYIGDPFAYKPILDAWNHRLSQRALLWRLDKFLSGKGWSRY